MNELKSLFTVLTVGLVFFFCVATSFAADNPFWDFSIYGTKDSKLLLQRSIDSESRAEKLRIRSYIAAKTPQTPEGIFSKAWLSGYEGRQEESNRLYEECTQRYPEFIVCLNNAVADHPDDLTLRQRYLDLAPETFDYAPVREYYTLLGKKGKKDEQKAFVVRMNKRYADKWIVAYLQSLEALSDGDRDARRAALRRAANDDKPPFFIYQELIGLETGYFFQGGSSRLDLAIKLVVQYLQNTNRFDEYEPWKYLIDEFAGTNENKVALLKQFVLLHDRFRAGSARPIPVEVLEAVTNRGESSANAELSPWLMQFRKRFTARRASEPAVAKTLLWFETATDGALPTLVAQWQTLVTNSLTEKDAADYAFSALDALTRLRGDCTLAQRLAVGWDQRFAGNVFYQRNALEASLCSNDLASSRQRVDAVMRLDPKQSASDRSDRMRVALAESQAKAWSEQERKNPFLTRWDQRDGGRVALKIEFASGSAAIPPHYAEQLTQLARLLKDNGADDYQFDIAGHTDNRGSAALNRHLSEQRAKAVVEYLVTKSGIERGRLTYSGHGSAFPVMSNATKAGMQQNRRVEITPRANLRTPVLAQEGNTNDSVALSPDGRVLATSDALWDVKTRFKKRDLPTASVRQLDFLPNGRTIVRLIDLNWPSRSERALETIDIASGLVMKRQLILGSAGQFAVSPDGRRLAMVNTGQIQIYALPTLQKSDQRMLSALATDGRVAWLDNDRLAASVRYGGEKLHLLNADTLATQKVFDTIDYVHTLGVSRTGKNLAAITDGGMLHVWDIQNWEYKKHLLGVHADRFVFHPFEEKALINQWSGTERKTRLIDLHTMSVIKTFDQTVTPAFTPDGRQFFFAGMVYDFASLEAKPWTQHKVGNDGASFGAWLPETGQFTTEDDKDSYLWDVSSGRQIDRLVDLNLCGKVQGRPTQFWKCGTNNTVMIERGNWQATPSSTAFKASTAQSIKETTASRVAVFERDPDPSKGRVAIRGKLSIIDRASGRFLATHPLLLRLEDAIYSSDDALHNGDVSTSVDPTGKFLAVTVWWKEHWGYPALSGKQVWLFNLENGKEIDRISLNKRAEKIAFAPGETPLLRVGFENDTGVYDIARKQWGKSELWSAKETLLAENGALKVVSLGEKLTLLDGNGAERYIFLRKSPQRAELYVQQNLMLVYYGSGEFDYYDLKTLSRQLTLHARQKSEWLAYAPSGEFSASSRGADGYYWALGDKYLPFSALRERFERPDVIARQLQKIVRGTAGAPLPLAATSLRQDVASMPTKSDSPQKPPVIQPGDASMAAPTIEADLFMPPFSLRLIDVPAKSSDPKVTLKIGITKLRAIGIEPEVELNINGQQVKTRALVRVVKKCDGKGQINCEQMMELPLNLDDGRNVVSISLLYRNARLETKTEVIELDRPRQIGQAAPRLWLFAAGVSQYAETRQNLKYADRDAEELAALLKTQEGKLYSQVNIKVLTNQQVIKGTMDNELNRFLRKATEQDLIVVLLAGHGVQDNDQTLYFMTHDANSEEPYTGLNVGSIRNILSNRPPNQKVILLLDICHAGAHSEGRRGTISVEDTIKQLTQGTGIIVLSSSTGRELSNEGANYRGGHGAFTSAVLEGLEGAADSASGNRDGTVTVLELITHVTRRVPELTKYSQHPMTDSKGLQDFPMAMKH